MVRRRRGLAAALPKPHAPCKRSPHRCRPRLAARKAAGPVAQWLEPAAHNGLVAGSSPAGPTRELNGLVGSGLLPRTGSRTGRNSVGRNQNQAVFADISITILNFASFSSPIGSIGYTAIQNEEGVRPTSQPCRLADVAIAPDWGRSAFALPALRRSKAMGFACERAVVGFATIRPIRGAGFLTYDFAFAFFAAICCSAQRAFFRTSGSWSSAMTARNASPSG